MLTYSPTQRNNTGLDPVNPALTAGEVQHQLAVYEFIALPQAEAEGRDTTWQQNRVELLKLRLLELNAPALAAPPPALHSIISRVQRKPVPAPIERPEEPLETPEPPAYDAWAEFEKAVLAV